MARVTRHPRRTRSTIATVSSIGTPVPADMSPTTSSTTTTASRHSNAPSSGRSSSAASPVAKGSTSCMFHAAVRVSKPMPSTAKIVHAASATHTSIAARTITYQSITTTARCTTKSRTR